MRGKFNAFRAGQLLALLLLLVACGGQSSPPNSPPMADPGPAARSAVVGAVVLLDASASADPDGDTLSYAWELVSRPAGSSAALTSLETVTTSFTPDLAGSYTIRLTVADGSAEDSSEVQVQAGAAPLADAGADRTVDLGDLVELDGSASSGPDGVRLDYAWEFLSQPDTSTATLQNATGASPRFTPDVAGQYRIQLAVTAGGAEARDTVTVQVNSPPMADAGPDREVELGDVVDLSGLHSTDPDGDSLSYAWSFVVTPDGGNVAITDADQVSASFLPPVVGAYVVELTVNDGRLSASARTTISVLPVGGAVRTALYVAPDGDDSASGDADAPLRTLEAALGLAHSETSIERIHLASGTYGSEPFDYEVSRDLQIIGPPEGAVPAVLDASGRVFDIQGPARLVLLRISVQSGGSSGAIVVRRDARIVLTESTCEATACITAGGLSSGNGGSISVNQSQLTGTGTGSGTGVYSFGVAGVSIANSTISNFATGVHAVSDQSLSILDSDLNGNGTAAALSLLATGLILDSRLQNNGLGLDVNLLASFRAQQTEITGGANGVRVGIGGSLVMIDVDISSNGPGVELGGATNSQNENIVIKGSKIHSNLAAIVVVGSSAILDLGSASDPGDNELSAGMWVVLRDDRPANSTGIIQMNGTTLNGSTPAAGSFNGPHSQDGWQIQNVGNTIVIH